MRFNTHDTTPRRQSSKQVRVMLTVCLSFAGACLLFFAAVCSYYAESVLAGVLMIAPFVVIGGLYGFMARDMNRAFVELDGDVIRVVDYYFCIKKEKTFSVADMASAQSHWGGSFRIRGYRWSLTGMSYIVFRSANGKYLFKILDTPETRDAFGALVQITMA